MLRTLTITVSAVSFLLGYAITSAAIAGDTEYYSRIAPAAGHPTVVETTTYRVQPVTTYYAVPEPQVMTHRSAHDAVVIEQRYGVNGPRDRYFEITRSTPSMGAEIDRGAHDNTAGANDPRNPDNRLSYNSCPPGQVKRGFC